MTRRTYRALVTATFAAMWPCVAVLFMLLGLLSMKRLGRAMERTGKNLQSYHW